MQIILVITDLILRSYSGIRNDIESSGWEFEMNEIIDLKLGLSTAYIICGESRILVDTGLNVPARKFEKIFRAEKNSPIETDLIIITHGHIDHFAHINYLKDITNASVLCHTKAAHSIRTGKNPEIVVRKPRYSLLKYLFSDKIKGYVPITPEITIENDMDLFNYGIDGKVVMTPGHSDCSVSVVLNSGNAIIGDLLLGSLIARKQPILPFFATDTKLLLSSLSKLVDLGVNCFYAAHGGPFKRKDVIKLLDRETYAEQVNLTKMHSAKGMRLYT